MNSPTGTTRRIACIGEAMAELRIGQRTEDPVELGFAGDTLNTAIYLKRLFGTSAEVAFVSVLGRDPLSRRMHKFIESERISTRDLSQSDDRLIGLYAIETDDSGERTFSYWRNQSAARTLFQKENETDFSCLAGYDVLCLSAITLAILPHEVRQQLIDELNRLRREQLTSVVFDSNYRPVLWESVEEARQTVARAWQACDIALPSVDDEQHLYGDPDEASVVSRLYSYGITRGALKRGSKGPLLLSGQGIDSPAALDISTLPAVEVVDTTAAGDSFNAGYLHALLSGASEMESVLAGHQCSVRVIAHKGAIIPREIW
ncbi:MAG: sugar kinase [Granulosicoccus sp.]|nr:sugar kinase [Granulosicoccus sp.]